MDRGGRRRAWSHWGLWFSIYGAAHGVERAPNFYLPLDLKFKQEKAEPMPKISLRQLAAVQGHHFGSDNGSAGK